MALGSGCASAGCIKARTDRIGGKIFRREQNDLARSLLRQAMNSVLRLKKVYKVESPVDVDCGSRLGEGQTFPGSRRIGY